MRRKLLSIILSLIALSSISASTLVMFDLSHPVYDEIETLYIIEGKASPFGAKPWSSIDVEHLLEWAEPVTEEGRRLSEKIRGYITEENGFDWKFGAALTPTAFFHSNPSDFSSTDDAYDIDALNDSLLDVSFTASYGRYVAGFVDFSLGVVFSDAVYYEDGGGDRERYSGIFSSNIPFLSENSISMNFPNRAYFAVGFDALRLVVGRDRLEWGNGIMGNMMLGDTLPYHDYLSLTFTGSKYFNYQMLMSFFTHSVNLGSDVSDRDSLNGLRFFLGHRFEFSLFSGRLLVALNESIMYQSSTGYFDPRILNPLLFLHDLYIAGNANSLATFEIEYAPIRNLSIYAQFAIDDLAMPNEPKPGDSDASVDGWGLMFGIRYIMPINSGYLFANFEGVYTSPFIYHRAAEDDSAERDLYYISSTRYLVGNSVRSITRYLSFRFGSDAIVGLICAGYDDGLLYRVSLPLMFMAHGVIDAWSTTSYGNAYNPVTPSTENPFDEDENGEIEYTLLFGAEGTIRPLSFLSIDTGAYCIFIWNKGNTASACTVDVQLTLGCTLKY